MWFGYDPRAAKQMMMFLIRRRFCPSVPTMSTFSSTSWTTWARARASPSRRNAGTSDVRLFWKNYQLSTDRLSFHLTQCWSVVGRACYKLCQNPSTMLQVGGFFSKTRILVLQIHLLSLLGSAKADWWAEEFSWPASNWQGGWGAGTWGQAVSNQGDDGRGDSA